MKKKLIDFSKVAYRNTNATEMRMRHNRGAHFKTGGSSDDDDPDDDDKEKEKAALVKVIEKRVTKLLADRASKEEIKVIADQLVFLTRGKDKNGKDVDSPFPIEALRQMADEKDGVMPKLVEMGIKIKELEAREAAQPKDMSIRGQINSWLESKPKELNGRAVKDLVQSIKEGVREQLPPIQIRVAASPMLVSTVNSGSSPYIGKTEIEAGVTPILRFDNTFWDFLTKGRTGAATYVWVNMTNPQGAAGFIGPGVAKPGISFELIADNSIAKKIAVKAKSGTELLQDIDGMETFIKDEMRAQLDLEINSKLMTGTSSSTVPAGIQSLSQPYSFYTVAVATLKTTNPNIFDTIRAGIAALRSGKIKGVITGFINPLDSANMDMTKANDSGVYIIPPFTTPDGKTIAGAKIIEDQNITPGSIQLGFLQYYRILIYQDYTFNPGWENDDFTKNLITWIAEMRLHQFFNQQYTGAFLYDTFENIKTAITQA